MTRPAADCLGFSLPTAGSGATPSDRFVASIVANDPKLRTMLAILRAMSPGEADAWLEVGRRMARADAALG